MPTTNRLSRPAALLLGALVLPVTVAACSSSSSGSSPTTTPLAGHQGTSSVCTLVTPAQIQSALGLAVEIPTVRNSTAATLCTFQPTDRSAPLDTVLIGFRGSVTPTVAAAEQQTLAKLHESVTDVSGAGVQAYYYSVHSGVHTITTLVSLVGETQVTVTSPASVAQAEALSTQIFNSFAAAATSTTTTPGATSTTTAAG